MKRTGIFSHYQEGERLRDFPAALAGVLEKENVFLFDAYYPGKLRSAFELDPVGQDVLSRVHVAPMIRQVKDSPAYPGALYSAAGTVAAAVRMWQGEIDNAFVFTGYGDHHAGADFFGGGCYFNGAAMAIRELRQRFGAERAAIIDTDAHHGNGTWQIFENDPDVLYACLCPGVYQERCLKVNIPVPGGVTDAGYRHLVETEFNPRARRHRPECLLWNWGYDGTQGEYGDLGLTPQVHAQVARGLLRLADELCSGRLIVVLCGGSRRDLARRLIPGVIRVLCG